MEIMTSFDALSRAKQMQSLSQLGHEVMRHYGISGSKIQFCSYSDNLVLRVDSEKIVKGYRTFALRIYNLSYTDSEIEATIRWMQALGRYTDVTVPEPIPARSGELISTARMPGTGEQRKCVLFQWLEGTCHDEILTPEHLRLVGEMTAQMHVFSGAYDQKSAADLPEINWRDLFVPLSHGDRLIPGWADRSGRFFSEEDSRIITQTAARALLAVRTFDKQNDYGSIHGDLHQWNYMFHNGSVRVFDFDDSCIGAYAYDMVITLWYLNHFASFHRDYQELVEAYLDGYGRIRAVPPSFHEQKETYMIARQMYIMRWVLGWPRSDHIILAKPFLRDTVQVFKRYLDG